jgi:hypothetical protein
LCIHSFSNPKPTPCVLRGPQEGGHLSMKDISQLPHAEVRALASLEARTSAQSGHVLIISSNTLRDTPFTPRVNTSSRNVQFQNSRGDR